MYYMGGGAQIITGKNTKNTQTALNHKQISFYLETRKNQYFCCILELIASGNGGLLLNRAMFKEVDHLWMLQ